MFKILRGRGDSFWVARLPCSSTVPYSAAMCCQHWFLTNMCPSAHMQIHHVWSHVQNSLGRIKLRIFMTTWPECSEWLLGKGCQLTGDQPQSISTVISQTVTIRKPPRWPGHWGVKLDLLFRKMCACKWDYAKVRSLDLQELRGRWHYRCPAVLQLSILINYYQHDIGETSNFERGKYCIHWHERSFLCAAGKWSSPL